MPIGDSVEAEKAKKAQFKAAAHAMQEFIEESMGSGQHLFIFDPIANGALHHCSGEERDESLEA